MNWRIVPAGDSAVLVEFDERIDVRINEQVVRMARSVEAARLAGVRDVVPTYRSVAVYFDPLQTDYGALSELLQHEAGHAEGPAEAGPHSTKAEAGPHSTKEDDAAEDDTAEDDTALRVVGSGFSRIEERLLRIPVCYGGDFGPDLAAIARHAGVTEAEVIARHSAPRYRVFMMGFLPGFTYLGTVDPSIAVGRHPTPRVRVPAGSVGIAGRQTGIYPLDTPGGWQLVGRTPVRMFDIARREPFLAKPGDAVQFYAIDAAAYAREASGFGLQTSG